MPMQERVVVLETIILTEMTLRTRKISERAAITETEVPEALITSKMNCKASSILIKTMWRVA